MSIHHGGRGPGHIARVQGGGTDWVFTNGALDSRITFTRASSGTYFDSAGVMQTATTNVPRFDYEYNGSAWVAKGLLIEPAATNLTVQSADFSTSWSVQNVVVDTNVGTSPDGTATADRLNVVVSNAFHDVFQAVTVVSGANYCVSDYFEDDGSGFAGICFGSGADWVSATWNLTTVALAQSGVGASGGTLVSSGIKDVGGGRYRCWLVGSIVATAGYHIPYTSDGAAIGSEGRRVYLGVEGEDLLIWGAQIEAGDFPTSHTPTTTGTVTRAADVAVITGANFSSWYNETEFTAVLEVSPLGACPAGATQRVLTFGDGTANNRILVYRTNSGTFLEIRSGGAQVALLAGAILAPNSVSKIAFSCKLNDFRLSINGGSVLADTAGAMPTGVDRAGIGYDETAPTENVPAHFRRLTNYPNGSFSDATLQVLSTL